MSSILLDSLAVWTQDTATIAGKAMDPSGAGIPRAKVTVSNPEKGFTRELVANDAGEYVADNVPIGNYLITSRAQGFMDAVCTGIMVSVGQTLHVDVQLLLPGSLRQTTPADPEGVLRAGRCSGYYEAMEERSLGELLEFPKAQAYRFVWLRSFHNPITVRLNIRADGTGLLTVKEISGTYSVELGPRDFILNRSREISKKHTQRFLARIEALKFWDIPYEEIRSGRIPHRDDVTLLDGAEWIVEGVRNGEYKAITRWSPDDGPIRTIGLIMVNDLAKMRITKHIY